MSADGGERSPGWADAIAAALILATEPFRLGGVCLRARPGPARDAWLSLFTGLLDARDRNHRVRLHRVPLHIADSRLLGGVDLAATLRAGRPIAERGVLATAHQGVLLLAMAERILPATAARIVSALDCGEVVVERDGFALREPSCFGVIALDEGLESDERPPAMLRERLALQIELGGGELPMIGKADAVRQVAAARRRLGRVEAGESVVTALCEAACALGIDSPRAPLFALNVARIAAAIDGVTRVTDEHVALAARLVFAGRATRLPQEQEQERARAQERESAQDPTLESASEPAPVSEPPSARASTPPQSASSAERSQSESPAPSALSEVLVESAQAAIPPGLLAQLRSRETQRDRVRESGRAGASQLSRSRGRPSGVMRGELGRGARLNLIETLRAAAPWQRVRHAQGRVAVRPEDFRVTRFKHVTRTTTVFVVDASGSAALHRLAEVKGAVELLLAECYVRRDRVALIAFRGRDAQVLLEPTRSLIRAKRSLAGLPGGGGTPLAAGLDAARALAAAIRQRGETPAIVLMTDGRANVARTGVGNREQAESDSLASARGLAHERCRCMLIDASPQPRPFAARLADEMRAHYLPLPHADATSLSRAVSVLTRTQREGPRV